MRGATARDLEDLYELSSFLDTVNLPHDRASLAGLLERASETFEGKLEEPGDRLHLLVVEDLGSAKAVGASMILGQLGTKRAPYVYFARGVEERYSRLLERHFRHETLRIRYVYDGPTELGGLVVHPSLRSSPDRLGRQIAFARFAVMAELPRLFQEECVAELLPPRRPDGGSDFWDAVGRRFTGLDYAQADRLSRVEKEFIRELFPEAAIYVSLLSPEARFPIGRVGRDTEPARAMLEAIGFREARRVDPFDGGPHFSAVTQRIHPVARAERLTLREIAGRPDAPSWLIARFLDTEPWVLAVRLGSMDGLGDACRTLECDESSEVLAVPLRNR